MKTSILDTIILRKKQEVAERMQLYPTALLERSLYFNTDTVSLKKYILRSDLNGIIAEFKRMSPSEGAINPYAKASTVTLSYMQAGASALSVLTDEKFFGGSLNDMEDARRVNYCPVLRKDFIVSEYQIIEARSRGADAVLLIAAALSGSEIRKLSSFAMSLGLEVLFEMHEEAELNYFDDSFIAGVNSRSLHDFNVSLDRAVSMAALLPQNAVKVAESGIRNSNDILRLKACGYNGFLIGTMFMKSPDPGKACAKLVREINLAGSLELKNTEGAVC
jgi:indole-3-glycerol phosphate synthase